MLLSMNLLPTLTATPLCITVVMVAIEINATIVATVDIMTAAVHTMSTTHAPLAKSIPDANLTLLLQTTVAFEGKNTRVIGQSRVVMR